MFDPPAAIAAVTFRDLANGIQDFCIGSGTDGVDGWLEAALRCPDKGVAQLCRCHQRQARIAGIVGIGPLEPGAAATQCAVEVKLHAVHAQLVVIQPRRGVCPCDQRHLIRPCGIGHDPQVQGAHVASAAERLPILYTGAHIGNGGNAVFVKDLLRFGQCQIAFIRTRGGNGLGHQFFGRVHEDARWLVRTRQLLDPPTRRGLRRGGDASRLQRQAVRPAGMAIDP